MESISIKSRVGLNVRTLRKQRGITADELARTMRKLGYNWISSRVSELERGTKNVSISELIGLSIALSSGNEYPTVQLAQFWEGVEPVRLNNNREISSDFLVSMFSGNARVPLGKDFPVILRHQYSVIQSELTKATGDFEEFVNAGGPDDFTVYSDLLSSAGEAENKAAKTFNVSRNVILAASVKLWNDSLTGERDRRAHGLQAQAKGHITRELLNELRHCIGKENGHD